MSALILFWFCYDDTLARLTETPGLGHVPFWMWFWIALVSALTSNAATATVRRRAAR